MMTQPQNIVKKIDQLPRGKPTKYSKEASLIISKQVAGN